MKENFYSFSQVNNVVNLDYIIFLDLIIQAGGV